MPPFPMNHYPFFRFSDQQKGFSLVELLVTIVMVSFAGIMIMQFMESSLAKSFDPIKQVKESFILQEIMDTVIADYKGMKRTPGFTLNQLTESLNHSKYNVIRDKGIAILTKTIAFAATGPKAFKESACSSDCGILKVTITQSGQSLTALFTP